MLREICRQVRDWTLYDAEVFSVHVIDDVIRALVQAAQLERALPIRGIKRVVHFFVFADDVRFGQIETDVVERAEILAAGEIFLLIQLQPFREAFLALGCKVEPSVFFDQRRQNKLRADDSTNTQRGGKIVVIVA